jgi:hypothetical protein
LLKRRAMNALDADRIGPNSRFVPRFAAACGAGFVLLCSTPARAEYVENDLGMAMAAITLATAGTTALGFDIANTAYLVQGPGDQPGRIVAAVGSMLAGCGLVIGAAVALSTVGEEHIPGGAGGSEEAAMRTARRLAAIDIGLAAVSLGLGIATIATYDSEASDHGPPADAVQMRLSPVVVPMAGGGAVGVAGQF